MTEHTPGPWNLHKTWGGVTKIEHGGNREVQGELVAVVDTWGDNEEANAALIASAPDLLEQRNELLAALEYLVSEVTVVTESENIAYLDALDAIAKAKGLKT